MRALELLKIVVVSLLLPLHEGFVLASDGEETVSVGREGGADDVLASAVVSLRRLTQGRARAIALAELVGDKFGEDD